MVTAHIRLPLTPALNAAVTARGPYAELVDLGKSLTHPRGQGPIANVAVGAGFVFTDLPHCGVNITVTARGDLPAARRTALQVLSYREYGDTSTLLSVPMWLPLACIVPSLALLALCALARVLDLIAARAEGVP